MGRISNRQWIPATKATPRQMRRTTQRTDRNQLRKEDGELYLATENTEKLKMKWIECLFVIIWICLIAGLQIWRVKVPEKSAIASNLTIVIIVLGAIGVISRYTYQALQKPSKKEVEEIKRKDREAIADIVIAKLREQFPDKSSNTVRSNEQKEYILKGIERSKSDDPIKILEDLVQQEKRIDTKIKENIKSLIERNKEISIFAQSQGKLIIALNATNKILEYSPQDSFAFRERGFINHRLGKVDDAEKDYLKSLELSLTDIEKASSLISVGIFYSRTAKLEKAVECYESAYKIGEKLDNSVIKASSDINLSNVYNNLGKTQEAETLMNRAIIEFEKIGDTKALAYAQTNQATYYLEHGKIHEAKERLESAKQIAEEEKDDLFRSAIYTNLSNLYSTLNDYYLAEEYALKAIEIDNKLKLEGSLATNHGNLGTIYRRQGKLLKAEEAHNKSLILFTKLNDEQGICRSLLNFGNIRLQQKNYEEAKKYFDKGLSIAKRIGNKQYIANGHGNLCVLHMEQGNFKDAETHIKEALSIYDDIDYEYEKASALYNLASIYKETGKKEAAVENWNESKKIFEKIGLPHMVENVNNELSKLNIDHANINDPNNIKRPYEFLIQTIKCKIPNGLVFSFEKINKDEEMTIGVNQETSFICFENDVPISINNFIERIRLYYEKNLPSRKEEIKREEIELNTLNISKYEITITFPPKTFFKPTDGAQLIAKGARCIIEIHKEFSKFSNFEMFSIDRDTVAQRRWASTKDHDIGMVLQKDASSEDKIKIGFQMKNGTMSVNKDGESYKDPLLELLKIELKPIE